MTVLPGARELTWTADDTAAVQAARTEFDQCLSEGCMAYTSDGDTHEQIRTFDPAARNVTVSRPLQGG
ncbi:MAG TPA: hypothetical protein VFW65_32210 [Pseudonocardiaceae bacterium]|nr:hypothetical protein [Pseudonocardiaceae bacterium]